jgi:hypothetical protein
MSQQVFYSYVLPGLISLGGLIAIVVLRRRMPRD